MKKSKKKRKNMATYLDKIIKRVNITFKYFK